MAGVPRVCSCVRRGEDPPHKSKHKDPLVVKNECMSLPNRPGFGVEVIPDVEKKFLGQKGCICGLTR